MPLSRTRHPEEELFDRPRGLVAARDCTLQGGAPIRWKLDNEGNPSLESAPIVFESPIEFVRTFSDDGASTWVGRPWTVPVRRNDLKFQTVTSKRGGSPGGITSIQLGYAGQGVSGEKSLPLRLSAIGPSLTFPWSSLPLRRSRRHPSKLP